MSESVVVSALVGDIYDAALNPTLWPGALGNAARFIGGLGAGLYAKDASSKTGNIFYHDGAIDPHYVALYFEKYVKLDPSTTGHFFAEVEKPVATEDLLPYDEFLQTRFYKEWAKPQGLVDHLSTVLDKSATSVAMFGVFRHADQGLADEAMRRRMRLVVPHVRRAVLIGRVIELRTAEAASLADTLDGIAAGMIMVEASGRIVHANAAGHALLAA